VGLHAVSSFGYATFEESEDDLWLRVRSSNASITNISIGPDTSELPGRVSYWEVQIELSPKRPTIGPAKTTREDAVIAIISIQAQYEAIRSRAIRRSRSMPWGEFRFKK
jgi:hypothetical protein